MTLKDQMAAIRSLSFAEGILETLIATVPMHERPKEAAQEAARRLRATLETIQKEPVTY